MVRGISLLSILWLFAMTVTVSAKEVPYTLEDSDRLVRVEARLSEIDKRFESIEKRFESIDKRFESIDKRFESLERQIDRQSIIFTALVVAVIGFAIWDRRTMIRPFEDKAREINKRIDDNEKVIKEIDESKVSKLVDALRDLATTDSKVAGVLKKYNLL